MSLPPSLPPLPSLPPPPSLPGASLEAVITLWFWVLLLQLMCVQMFLFSELFD